MLLKKDFFLNLLLNTNFFKQRKKFHSLWAHQFKSSQLVEEEVTLPGIDKEQDEETSNNESLIFLNESLTPANTRLLKEAKKGSRQYNYKYKGYTVNQEVRVKNSDHDDHTAIQCLKDLEKIVWSPELVCVSQYFSLFVFLFY